MTIQIKSARRGKLRLAFGVQLAPGINDIDAVAWERCKGHPITAHYIDSGEVSEVATVSAPEQVTPPCREPTIDAGTTGPAGADTERSGSKPPPQPKRPPYGGDYGEPESPPLPIQCQDDPAPQPEPKSAELPQAAVPESFDVSGMSAKDAAAEVGKVDSIETLKRMLEREGRTTVIRAIMRRLGELGT